MQSFNLKPSIPIPDVYFLSPHMHLFYNFLDTLFFLECGNAQISFNIIRVQTNLTHWFYPSPGTLILSEFWLTELTWAQNHGANLTEFYVNPDKQVLPESGHFEFTYVRTPELICLSLDTLSLPTIQVLTCTEFTWAPTHTEPPSGPRSAGWASPHRCVARCYCSHTVWRPATPTPRGPPPVPPQSGSLKASQQVRWNIIKAVRFLLYMYASHFRI